MKKLTYIALAMCSTFTYAQNSITNCSSSFADIGGQESHYFNDEISDWLICPDDNSKYLNVEFTYVDIETADDVGVKNTGCRDVLYIYDGIDDNAPLVGSFCGQESTNGETPFVDANTLHVGMAFTPNNLGGCFYFKFESDEANTRNGWEALIECCEPTLPSHISDGVSCPEAINQGVVFDFEVDLNCVRQGSISNFTDYEYDDLTPPDMIAAEMLPFKAYYKFEANSVGTFTSINVDPIDDLGVFAFYAFGPLTGDCPEYTGGFVVDCKTAEDPSSLIFNVSPNSSYIIAVASNVQGKVRLFNDLSTLSLPVELIDYSAIIRGDNVDVKWTTAQEINNQGFELYRSFDKDEFELIAEIKAKGNIGSITDYAYTDFNVLANRNVYYYLRQIDLDGTTTDFDIKSVKIEKEVAIFTCPNPAKESLYIEAGDNTAIANVTIFDSMGSMVLQRESALPIDLDVSNLSKGIYTLVVQCGTTMKVVRQVIN